MSERRERPSFTLLSLHSCRSSCRHSSSNPHGMNECSERVTWGEGGRDRDADRHEERSEVTKEPDPRSVPPPFILSSHHILLHREGRSPGATRRPEGSREEDVTRNDNMKDRTLQSHSHPFRSTAAPVSLHNLRRYARMKVIREAREP